MTRTEFIDLLDAYWNAAYHEGEAAATTDTPDGRAGKINSALMREYDALAARLAEAEAERDRMRHGWQRECVETNGLLQLLGLCPSEYRSDGGSLLLGRIKHKLRPPDSAPVSIE